MSNKKKYIMTSITLGAIASISAVLIALSNLATKDKIAQNEIDRINAGITNIFGKNAVISAQKSINEYGLTVDTSYISTVYTVKNNENTELGLAFRTTGSNSYGKISLLAGFDKTTKTFMKVSLIINEQSFASTLVDNYVNPLNNGDLNISDKPVNVGATRGAELVQKMVLQAQDAALEIWK